MRIYLAISKIAGLTSREHDDARAAQQGTRRIAWGLKCAMRAAGRARRSHCWPHENASARNAIYRDYEMRTFRHRRRRTSLTRRLVHLFFLRRYKLPGLIFRRNDYSPISISVRLKCPLVRSFTEITKGIPRYNPTFARRFMNRVKTTRVQFHESLDTSLSCTHTEKK